MKYNEAMKSADCKASYKKGAGIIEEGKKYIKEEGKKYIKGKAKDLVDAGADFIKEKVIGGGLNRPGKMGKGIFGDITKGVSGFVLDQAPIPGIARDIGKMGTNYLIDKSGMGLMKRTKRNHGGALYMA